MFDLFLFVFFTTHSYPKYEYCKSKRNKWCTLRVVKFRAAELIFLLMILLGYFHAVFPVCSTREARPCFWYHHSPPLPLAWISSVCQFIQGLQFHLFTCSEVTAGFEPTTTRMSSNAWHCAFTVYATASRLVKVLIFLTYSRPNGWACGLDVAGVWGLVRPLLQPLAVRRCQADSPKHRGCGDDSVQGGKVSLWS